MSLDNRIKELLLTYVATITHTGTHLETNNENFFKDWFDQVPYLKAHPEYQGFYPVKDDYLERKIPWALLKGQGNKTIVLIHHTDTVDIEDFGLQKDYAYRPYELTNLLKNEQISLSAGSKQDLDSGEWLFGRAVADMKGGAAIHLALFEEYAEKENFTGNLLLLGLPDEENSSAGMRSAAYLLKELALQHQLDYVLMLNVEPHERLRSNETTIYDGSIGKIMPMFLVRGKLAHSGQIYLGLNPVSLLSEIIRRTELNTYFIESAGNTTSPPPTWLYMKDRKYVYDVSLPLYAGGYMNILPLKRSPKSIMAKLKEISQDAFVSVIEDHKKSYQFYQEKATVDYGEINFTPNVMFYSELVDAVIRYNPAFESELEDFIKELQQQMNREELDRVEACYRVMEKTIEQYPDKGPMVIIALSPPYYPSVNNRDLLQVAEMQRLVEEIESYAKTELKSELSVQNYYTGICDLSYAMFTDSDDTIDYIKDNTLLWGEVYSIPLEVIKELSMPVLNIGPWGKEFHTYTERVYLPDLFHNTPKLIKFTIDSMLKE